MVNLEIKNRFTISKELSMQKIAVLFNPSSRRGKSGKARKKVERILNASEIDYDIFISESEEHLKQLTVETAWKYSTLVGVGGDTTLNIMVRWLLKSGCPLPVLGMIGTGSANDIARSLGIYSIEDACKAIKKGTIAEMDIGRIRIDRKSKPYFFLGSLSTGLGTTVNRYIEQFQQNHKYITRVQPFFQFVPGLCGIHNYFSHNKQPAQIIMQYPNGHNGESVTKNLEFSLLVFLNTPYYAKGLKLGSEMGSFDGRLDCCVIDTRGFWDTCRMGLKIQRGTHTRCDNVELVQSPTFKINAPEPIDILADGEIIERVREFEVSLSEERIKVLCN